jgi:transposase InsO family protein
MVRRACPRETRDRDPMAPSRVPQVLDLALATPAHRSALHQCWPARADPSHGCGEPDLGRSPDSRRASDAGDRRLGAYGLKVPPSSAAQSRRAQALDPVPAQPPRGDRGDGLLHRTDSDLPHPLRLVLDRSRPEAHSPRHDSAIRHLIFDRDAIFCGRVVSTAEAVGLRPTRTSYRSPWQNGIAERWVGNVRRELLDHAVVFNERHLRRLSTDYVAYYHDDRTHYALEKQTPGARLPSASRRLRSTIVARQRLGGLHHRYDWAA